MPDFISLRSFRLESTKGHIVLFEANVPRFIPDAIVPEAMAAGCAPVDKSDIPFYEDKSRAAVEFQGDMRSSLVFMAAKHVALRNNSKDFTGGGAPKAQVLTEALGFDVNQKEATEQFQRYSASVQDGFDVPLHPQAANVLKVIEAGDRDELLDLGVEFGVEKDKAKGLTLRELRKTLLVKLTGVALG